MLIAADIGFGPKATLFWNRVRKDVWGSEGPSSGTPSTDLLVLGGDLSYAGQSRNDFGKQEAWDTFFDDGEEIMSAVPSAVVAGNHDGYSDPPFQAYVLRWPALPYGDLTFNNPSGSMYWYSFNQGPMHVVVISTEHCVSSQAVVYQQNDCDRLHQIEWLETDLSTANSNRTAERPWVVVIGHRPLYSSSAKHPTDKELVASIEPSLFRHGVDVAVWGHTHMYERTKPLLQFKEVPGAPVHITVGPAGRDYRTSWVTDSLPAWDAKRETTRGYAKLIATKRCELKAEYFDTKTGDLHDSFVLTYGDTAPNLINLPLITWGDTWKYWAESKNPGTEWNLRGYTGNADLWKTGRGPLGFGECGPGDAAAGTAAPDCSAYAGITGTQVTKCCISYFFRKDFYMSDTTCFGVIEGEFVRDDGAVVYINGVEVMRSNMPPGYTSWLSKAAKAAPDSSEMKVRKFSFNASDYLQAGKNMIAVSVHQRSIASSDLVFDLKLSAVKQQPCYDATIVSECQQKRSTIKSTLDVVVTTCTDGKMNGDEGGVDCGGSCAACVVEAVVFQADEPLLSGDEMIVVGAAASLLSLVLYVGYHKAVEAKGAKLKKYKKRSTHKARSGRSDAERAQEMANRSIDPRLAGQYEKGKMRAGMNSVAATCDDQETKVLEKAERRARRKAEKQARENAALYREGQQIVERSRRDKPKPSRDLELGSAPSKASAAWSDDSGGKPAKCDNWGKAKKKSSKGSFAEKKAIIARLAEMESKKQKKPSGKAAPMGGANNAAMMRAAMAGL